jgi:5'-methylthioadenosine phosphorylase
MTAGTLPRAEIGSIGGSGTWGMRFPEDLQRPEVSVVEYLSPIATPYGVSCPLKLLDVGGQRVLRVPMHGHHRDAQGHSVPTWTNALQVAWIYQQAGVQWVLVDGSVGGIQHPHPPNAALPPWSVVIPDDFIQHWIPPTTARLGRGGSRLREPLCGGLRRHLLAAARRQEQFSVVVDGGVYVCTPPGRFETAAEIRMLAGWGAHIVGQTLGHEAPLMRQLGIHFGSLNIVSNYAEGKAAWSLTEQETMEQFYRRCAQPVGNALLDAMLTTIQNGIGECRCGDFQIDGLGAFPVEGA